MMPTRSKLGRKPPQRRGLVRNLVTSLILYESIRTTKTRAKTIQPIIDRIITKAKTRSPHIAVRFLDRIMTDKNASRKVFEVLVDRFNDRSSGFTTISAIGRRKGDGAELVEISLVTGKASSKNSS